MYKINVKKFQNTPRGTNGKAIEGEKRIRLPQSAFEVEPFHGRGARLHPTKGWRSRNVLILEKHGALIRELDYCRQRNIRIMLTEREERKKQRVKKESSV